MTDALAAIPDAKPRLFTLGFAALLAATFLAYAQNFLVQSVLPLLILSLGGDAVTVGAIVAAYSIPSIIARPFIGRIVDERGANGPWAIGAAMIAIANLFYLVPSLVLIFALRVFHGAGWAAFNTGGHTTLAQAAPAARRGQATSIYNLVIGVAQLALPGLGLLLWSATGGAALPFIIAAIIGLVAFVLIRFGPVPRGAPGEKHAGPSGGRQALLERGAILPMMIEFLFTLSLPVYFTFLPVYAVQRGIPLPQIAIFFPIYGVVFVGARFLLAPYADRIGRRLLLVVGVTSGLLGMLAGFLSTDLTGIILSGLLYAFGASQASPAAMALAIDRSDPRRIGAAMATYSIGYQFALGAGAAVLGLVIDAFGFPAPFALGVAVQAVLLGILFLQWSSLTGRPRAAAD
jgi:MFS family permease